MQRRTFLYDGVALMAVAACAGDESSDDAMPGTSESPGSQADGGPDASAVLARAREIVDAANGLDLERLMSYMHPDITYLVPSRPPIQGWDAVRTYYGGVHERARSTGRQLYLTAVTHQVVVCGAWAWKYGESHAVMTPLGQPAEPAAGAAPGAKTLGIYKNEDGQWLRYVQMRNGNTPEMNI